jgi:hypothetical protein
MKACLRAGMGVSVSELNEIEGADSTAGKMKTDLHGNEGVERRFVYVTGKFFR